MAVVSPWAAAMWGSFVTAIIVMGVVPRFVVKYRSKRGTVYGALVSTGVFSAFVLVAFLWRVLT